MAMTYFTQLVVKLMKMSFGTFQIQINPWVHFGKTLGAFCGIYPIFFPLYILFILTFDFANLFITFALVDCCLVFAQCFPCGGNDFRWHTQHKIIYNSRWANFMIQNLIYSIAIGNPKSRSHCKKKKPTRTVYDFHLVRLEHKLSITEFIFYKFHCLSPRIPF